MLTLRALYLLASITLVAAPVAHAEDGFDFLKRSETVIMNAEKQTPPDWLMRMQQKPDAASMAEARKVLQSAQRHLERTTPMRMKNAKLKTELVVCVTFASPTEMKQTLEALSAFKDDDSVRIAIQGLPKGCRTFGCAIRTLASLGLNNDFPPVSIDPLVFRRYGVVSAPTMLYLEKGKLIAKVEGNLNPDWLREKVKAGEKGDLGKVGPVVALVEKNLMDEIQERLAKWRPKSPDQMLRAYWHRKKFVELPPASKEVTYAFTPRVKAEKDIKDAKGRVLVAAGTVVNPLKVFPFSKAIIVYDPSREGERERAKELLHHYQVRGKASIVMITKPEQPSLASIAKEEEALGVRVYLLQADIAKRLHIRHTISTIEAVGEHLEVSEYPSWKSS